MTKPGLLFAFAPAILLGCVNVPTDPSEIKGIYISSLRYEPIDCSRLLTELDVLTARENAYLVFLGFERRIAA